MRGNHLLIEKAFTYEGKIKPEDPEGCSYDDRLGAWLVKGQNEFLVKSNDAERPRVRTKKQDQETGEDQKGA
jgi:hypothetical protein